MKRNVMLAVVALVSVIAFSAPAPANVGPMKKDQLRGGELVCLDLTQKVEAEQAKRVAEKNRELAVATPAQ